MEAEREPNSATGQVQSIIVAIDAGFRQVIVEILRGLLQQQGHAGLALRFVG
jgi:hypothetical protein